MAISNARPNVIYPIGSVVVRAVPIARCAEVPDDLKLRALGVGHVGKRDEITSRVPARDVSALVANATLDEENPLALVGQQQTVTGVTLTHARPNLATVRERVKRDIAIRVNGIARDPLAPNLRVAPDETAVVTRPTLVLRPNPEQTRRARVVRGLCPFAHAREPFVFVRGTVGTVRVPRRCASVVARSLGWEWVLKVRIRECGHGQPLSWW